MGRLRNLYNNLVEPGLTLDETLVPDEDDLRLMREQDFKNWVPPTQDQLGDDRKMAP